ncbi:MAG: helix-turn-helix transcriptional regulator [Gemmatimonadaceae bacterium]|jgi:DNA-binding HxlR family transcriptional regulator|nr:helix-turn-helix transcriptional regulator [Gemmatimonadaceae bacterium]
MSARHFDWQAPCTVEATLAVIGGVWKPVILFHLLDGPRRFSELARLLPGATARMLTLHLRELEADGVVTRAVTPSVPPRVDYSLTSLGDTLAPVLQAMRTWGAEYQRLRQTSQHVPVTPGRAAP